MFWLPRVQIKIMYNKKENEELEKDVIRMHKEGLHPVTIAARTGFRTVDVRAIIKEKEVI